MDNILKSEKFAFTLAEVLITLGIIGVVAALTIPTLVQKYQKQVLKTQLLKTYSELSQIGQLALVDDIIFKDITSNLGDAPAANERLTLIMKYFKRSKQIITDADYKNHYKSVKKIYPNGVYKFDGSATTHIICDNSGVWQDSTGRYFLANDGGHAICVDINGAKPPNRFGYDYFVFCYKENNKLFTDGDPDNSCNNISATYTYTYNAITDQFPDDKNKSYWKNLKL